MDFWRLKPAKWDVSEDDGKGPFLKWGRRFSGPAGKLSVGLVLDEEQFPSVSLLTGEIPLLFRKTMNPTHIRTLPSVGRDGQLLESNQRGPLLLNTSPIGPYRTTLSVASVASPMR